MFYDEFKKSIQACSLCPGSTCLPKTFGYSVDTDAYHKYLFLGESPLTSKKGEFMFGKGLSKLLAQLNNRKITNYVFDNVVRCEKRGLAPKLIEMINCAEHTVALMRHLKPTVTVLFGRNAMAGFYKLPIGNLPQQVVLNRFYRFEFVDCSFDGVFVVTHHFSRHLYGGSHAEAIREEGLDLLDTLMLLNEYGPSSLMEIEKFVRQVEKWGETKAGGSS